MSNTQSLPSRCKSFLTSALRLISPTTLGISLALVSTGLFVFTSVLVRNLSTTIDTFQILLFRQIIFVLVLIPAIYSNLSIIIKPNYKRWHVARILGAFSALYFGYITVSHLPLANAQALGFVQVLFVAMLSKTILSELVSLHRWVTVVCGFFAVLLIVQPDFSSTSILYTGYGLLGALGAAVAVICVRKVSQSEPKITLLSYQALFVGLMALLPAIQHWVWPNVNQLCLLVLIGVISAIAQWIGVTAYQYAKANIIANVQYASILYSLGFGMLLFAEYPNTLATVGIILLVCSAGIPLVSQKLNKPNRKQI